MLLFLTGNDEITLLREDQDVLKGLLALACKSHQGPKGVIILYLETVEGELSGLERFEKMCGGNITGVAV